MNKKTPFPPIRFLSCLTAFALVVTQSPVSFVATPSDFLHRFFAVTEGIFAGEAYADVIPPTGMFLSPATTYTYDVVGNRLTTSALNTPASYTPNALNQYQKVDGATFSYDPTGNLTSDGTQTYTYDFENRLVRVIVSGSEAIYAYDPFGRRLSRGLTPGGQTPSGFYLYDGDDLIAETDSEGNLTKTYLFGPGIDEPLEMVDHPAGATHYYHADGLGSITALTRSDGSVAESYACDPYGIPTTTSALGNRFLFTGREYDSESGLYHYRARAYSPRLGRFLQRDPIGEFADINLYRYVGNSPLNWIDPFGETPVLAIGVGLTIFGGVVGGVIGGIEAYQGGESILAGVGRGFLRGTVATGTGVLTTLITRSPAAIGALSGLSGDLAGQGFDIVTQGKTFNAGRLASQTALGALLGPVVNRAIPLQGRRPNLFKLRALAEFNRPNTQRLFRRVSLGALLKSISNTLFGAFGPNVQGQIEQDILGDGTRDKK